MEKQRYVVIGLGNFGLRVAETLAAEGAPVIIIDKDENLVEKMKNVVTEAIIMDSADEEALKNSGIKPTDVVVVSMGKSTEAATFTVALLKAMGIKKIIARGANELHAKVLRSIGADKVVVPEEDMGERVAKIILSPFREYVDLGDNYNLVEIEIGAKSNLVGKTLRELNVRDKYHVSILLIKRIVSAAEKGEEEEVDVIREFPTSEYLVKKGDILVIMGETEAINKFKEDM